MDKVMMMIHRLDKKLHELDEALCRDESDLMAQKNSYEQKLQQEVAAIESKQQNMRANMYQRMERIYKEAEDMYRELIAADDNKFLTDFISSIKKDNYNDLYYRPKRYKLNTIEDCVSALGEIKAEYNQVRFQFYAGNSFFGKGINSILKAVNQGNAQQLRAVSSTLFFFQKDLKENIDDIMAQSSMIYEQKFLMQKKGIEAQHYTQKRKYEEAFKAAADKMVQNTKGTLVQVLSQEDVLYIEGLLQTIFRDRYKVNLSRKVRGGYLNHVVLHYNVSWIRSDVLKKAMSYIYEKIGSLDCSTLFFPYGMRVDNSVNWLIKEDNSDPKMAQDYVCRLMLDTMSCVSAGNLVFTIVDPIKKGNSITAFSELRSLIPDLFGEKIYCEKEDISQRIRRISKYIDHTIAEKLGNTYSTVYEYEAAHPDYRVQTELLVLFDYPSGIDEGLMPDFLNIISNGSKCGVYTCICQRREETLNYSAAFLQGLDMLEKMSTKICQKGSEFWIDQFFTEYGTRLKDDQVKKFFNTYILFFEEEKKEGAALSPLLRNIIFSKDVSETQIAITQLYLMKKDGNADIDRWMDSKKKYPENILVGNILYPASLFLPSCGYDKMAELFGRKSADDNKITDMALPLYIDLHKGEHFYVKCSEKIHNEMLRFSHNMIWSFICSLPAGKINICIFDGKERGNSIMPFLDFRKQCPGLFDEKIYTNQDDMHDRLRRISDQIDEFIQDKLGNKYQDFLEYNQNTPKRAEAVTILLLYDFPYGMDQRNLEILRSIMQNGKRCGVYVMIYHNTDVSYNRYDDIDGYIKEFKKYSLSLEYKAGKYLLMPYGLPVEIPPLISDEERNSFAASYLKLMQKVRNQGISPEDILPNELFTASSSKKILIPVGVGDRDETVSLVMGEGSSHHGLIVGATGSGKSTLLHTIITNSMLKYSPDQLQLYLMDFKSGTEFKIYESMKLPHIKLLAIDAMQEFGESILENLVQEMEHRAELFKETADGVTSVNDYVKATGNAMPRILVIIDEFQILFNDAANRRVAEHCAELAKRIVTEGRAFGIHLLMATQSIRGISNMTLLSGIMEQMLIRIGLKCGEADIRYMFSNSDCGKIQTMMKGPIGTAVINQDYTEKSDVGMRVAYYEDTDQQEYLEKISTMFRDMPSDIQIFEGKRTEKLLDYFKTKDISPTDQLPVQVHMGVPIKVAPPYVIDIDKKRKHNLLVCGSDPVMSSRIVGNYMISVILNENSSIYCVDGDILVDDYSDMEFYQVLGEYSHRFHLAEDRGSIVKMIDDVYEEYKERKKRNRRDSIFVVFKNLQFLDIVGMMLRGEPVDRSDYLDEAPVSGTFEDTDDPLAAFNFDAILPVMSDKTDIPVGDKLLKLIESGSMYGIYFLISSLEYQTVRDSLSSYGTIAIKHFPERIVFSLSANDAENLLEDVGITGLSDNTVYFTDGIREKVRMKPYILPTVDELREFLKISRS